MDDRNEQAFTPYQPYNITRIPNASSSSVIIFPCSQEDVEQETFDEKPRSIILGLLKQVKPGADLSRITLPTFILEPRSLLERVTDFMAHQHLLLHANLEENPIRRFIHVLRYYLSGWHIRPKGIKKPYNPVLGEHFRCHWDVPFELFQFDQYTQIPSSSSFSQELDGLSLESLPHLPATPLPQCPICSSSVASRSYYVAEQVSHHPPISAYFFANPAHHTSITGNFRPKSKFLGNSGASLMHGTTHIYFTNRSGEEYIITNPNLYIRGIILGTMLMELGDSITIECPATGLVADIEFKVKGYFTGTYNAISGKIRHVDTDRVLYNISGKWTDKMTLTPIITKNKRCTPVSQSQSYSSISEDTIVLPEFGSAEPHVILDVSSLHSISLTAPNISDQNPFESRRLWSQVTQAILDRDMDRATAAKTWIEDRQRTTVRLRSSGKPLPSPNPFNLTQEDLAPWSSRYFYSKDNIRWHFKKRLEDLPLSEAASFLDSLITDPDSRIPDSE